MVGNRFIHISQYNPETHGGGVAQFARDLRGAIPELEFAFHGDASGHPGDRTAEKNEHLLESGVITSNHTVIADGYYGLGLAGKVKRLVLVCHSTYAGWIRDWAINPPPCYEGSLPWLMEAEKYQRKAYEEADEIVAVCTSAAAELKEIYGLDSTIIFNGVDTNLYEPAGRSSKLAEVAGGDENKGSDVISKLRGRGWDISPLGFEGEKHERWQKFGVALLPSRHEGGSYAQLEAMATGLEIVSYKTGFFKYDVPESYIWGTYDYHWTEFESLVRVATGDIHGDSGDSLPPRDWVMKNATLEMFKQNWGRFLEAPA